MPEGFFSGVIEGQQAAQGQQLRQLAIQEGGIKVQSEEVALKQAKLMLNMQEQISKRMSHMNSGPAAPGAPLEEQTTALASEYLEMARMTEAFPEQSERYSKAAMDVMKGQSEVTEKYYHRQQDDMQFASNLMEGVHDEQSFKAAALQAITERPEMANMYGGVLGKVLTGEIPYSPQTAKLIHDSAIKAVDQARIKLDDMRGKEAEARISYLASEKKAAEARARASDALAEERKRGGGKEAGTIPSAAQYNAIMGLVNEKYSEPGVDPSVLRRKALQAAQRTRELSGPKGELMDLDTASKIAFKEAEDRGDFKDVPRSAITAGSAANPRPLPPGKDPSILKKGQYYTNKRGVVQQWLGVEEGWGPAVDTSVKFEATDEENQEDQEGQEYPENRTTPEDYQPARERGPQ